jgi:hypothetical protein
MRLEGPVETVFNKAGQGKTGPANLGFRLLRMNVGR